MKKKIKKIHHSLTEINFESKTTDTTEALKICLQMSVNRKYHAVQQIYLIYSTSLRIYFNKNKAMKKHQNKQSDIEG